MANIIKFPKTRLGAPPQSPEELAEKLEEYRRGFSDDVAEQLWNIVIIEMVRSGCRFEEQPDKYYPSIILLLESIKSLHLQAHGIDHPLQELAKDFIEEEELDKESVDISEIIE